MSFLNKVFGKKTGDGRKPASTAEADCVVCPKCGATYHTEMLVSSIMLKTPDMAELAAWTTQVACRSCGNPITVTGSYKKAFGSPKPG